MLRSIHPGIDGTDTGLNLIAKSIPECLSYYCNHSALSHAGRGGERQLARHESSPCTGQRWFQRRSTGKHRHKTPAVNRPRVPRLQLLAQLRRGHTHSSYNFNPEHLVRTVVECVLNTLSHFEDVCVVCPPFLKAVHPILLANGSNDCCKGFLLTMSVLCSSIDSIVLHCFL